MIIFITIFVLLYGLIGFAAMWGSNMYWDDANIKQKLFILLVGGPIVWLMLFVSFLEEKYSDIYKKIGDD